MEKQQDHLEKFILNNRPQFDEFELKADIWQKLEARLDSEVQMKPQKQVKVLPLVYFKRLAASFALILVCLASYHWYYNRQMEQNHVGLEQIVPELAEAEQFYMQEISTKQSALKHYDLKKYGMEKDFQREYHVLDSSYTELKKELYRSGSQEVVVGAMVENLQIRIELLNQQLAILAQIQEMQKGEKPKDSKDL
jgi:hypothetical protein